MATFRILSQLATRRHVVLRGLPVHGCTVGEACLCMHARAMNVQAPGRYLNQVLVVGYCHCENVADLLNARWLLLHSPADVCRSGFITQAKLLFPVRIHSPGRALQSTRRNDPAAATRCLNLWLQTANGQMRIQTDNAIPRGKLINIE